MPIVETDGRVHIRLNTGELLSDGGTPREFADWQAAQREYAEGHVPSGIENEIREAKRVKANQT